MQSFSKIKQDLVRNTYFLRTALFFWTLIFPFGIMILESSAQAEEVAYRSHGRRDPFTPLVTLAAKTSAGLTGIESVEDVTIEGIVYDPKHGSVVVVNGAVMKEGEESGSLKVVQIKADGVWFLVNGAKVYKPMYQSTERNA